MVRPKTVANNTELFRSSLSLCEVITKLMETIVQSTVHGMQIRSMKEIDILKRNHVLSNAAIAFWHFMALIDILEL